MLTHNLIPARAQFVEDFDGLTTDYATNALKNWNTATGDGDISFTQKIDSGFVRLRIDARRDERNIWYAFMQTAVSDFLDLQKLGKKEYGLRIEARVRPSHAPRRINLYLPVLGKTHHHDNLMEFDLPEAGRWHTISMTISDLMAEPDDTILGQVSMMDWGNTDIYTLDVDYVKVEIVELATATPDLGNTIGYRPPLADPASFQHALPVSQEISVDQHFPSLNLYTYTDGEDRVLPVGAGRTILFQWDTSPWKGKEVAGHGQLEFCVKAVSRLKNSPKDFGEVRICEILTAAPDWKDSTVTYDNFTRDSPLARLINEQTIVDTPLHQSEDGKVTVTISKYVLQRLMDGTTRGIAIRPLGLIDGLLYTKSAAKEKAAVLRVNFVEN